MTHRRVQALLPGDLMAISANTRPAACLSTRHGRYDGCNYETIDVKKPTDMRDPQLILHKRRVLQSLLRHSLRTRQRFS